MGVRVETIYLRGLEELVDKGEQAELAEALKVTEGTISLLVNRKRGASLALALRLAKRLNVSVEELVYGPVRKVKTAA